MNHFAAITYSDVLQNLESRPIMPDRPPALDFTLRGLKRIGIGPHEVLNAVKGDLNRVIVVAGTNGKGSVSATLDALFTAAGERTGLYTSPHLTEYTERIRIGGQDISRELFAQAFAKVAEKTSDLKLSHFEMLTLMAAWVFFSGEAVPPVERAIFEVGVGGLWDSTNAIPHGVAVIATLGKDHEKLLGHTLNEIAVNKFGIIPEKSRELPDGAWVYHLPIPEEVKPLARKTQERTQSRWVECANFKYSAKRGATQAGEAPTEAEFCARTPWGRTPPLRLPGFRGAQNTALALTVFAGLGEPLGYSTEKTLPALTQVRWPGRMERFDWANSRGERIPLYLSADHNPQGVDSLVELLPYYPRERLHVLAGVVHDKDLDGVLGPIFDLTEASVYLTEVSFRKRPLDQYGRWLEKASGAWAQPAQALREIGERAQPGDLIVVTGSAYLVGEVRGALHSER